MRPLSPRQFVRRFVHSGVDRWLWSSAGVLRATLVAIACLPATLTAAPKLTTICTFTRRADGANPHWSGLVPGKRGSFFSETVRGGAYGVGTVFQMTPSAPGALAWTLTTI